MAKPRKIVIRKKTYDTVREAVEAGVKYGVRRAYKYTAYPREEDIVENVEREVMNSLSEVIDYDLSDGKKTVVTG